MKNFQLIRKIQKGIFKEISRLHATSAQFSSEITTAKPLRNQKLRSNFERKNHFVDFCKVVTMAGNGGDGCISFLKLWKNPMAGPSGGDGGNGGHVIFQANSCVKSLVAIQPVIRADSGERGYSKDMHGASGKHKIIEVPVWTSIRKDDELICDLNEHGARFVASRGGAGGHGNHFFLSNENRHPDIAEAGAEGEIQTYTLELKIMAHVGLVGFPNAGKSTLLRAISRARPKVAAYPFTTLNPHVGIVHYDDYVQLAVADLPGLIPDAHKNRGLGINFLKHIERCLCILYVIDLSVEKPWEQFQCLQNEMEQFQAGLSKRPHAIVGNKFDLLEAQKNLPLLKEKVDISIYPISAKEGNNVRVLLEFLRSMYDKHIKNDMVW